jgi:hypothetical protein
VQVRFGPKRPDDGWLPVFSVDTEEEAEQLLIASCPRGLDGAFYAPELAQEQTLENLQAFSDRLLSIYTRIKERKL